MNQQFQRIERLPPYVFNIIGELKQQARARGEDIIDFGMGNPDQPTPQHIVDKLKDTVERGDTHRYSQSKGIPRLRKAMCDWYASRYDVELDPETEAIVTLGSKEGLAGHRARARHRRLRQDAALHGSGRGGAQPGHPGRWCDLHAGRAFGECAGL